MYQLPQLPYLFQDLESFIDTHTMGLHYHKHEQSYINKLNELLIQDNYDYRYNLGELIYHLNEFKERNREDILYNLGGVLNHNLYWKSMHPKRQKPFGNLKEQIIKQYGNFEHFKERFKESALKLKGSGYTFLVLNKNGNLDIINTSNQQTPLSFGLMPLFTIDMWEHAYYLNYQNEKNRYIDNFFEIADFANANHIFNNVTKQRETY